MKNGLIATGVLGLLIAAGGRISGAPPADAAKGKAAFEDSCGVCHQTDTEEKGEKMGPGLKGLFKRAKMKNGKAPTEANVKAVINAGGNGMPAFSDMLSDEERTNVLAYLKTL